MLNKAITALQAFRKEEDGLALTEYLILLGLLTAAVITAVALFGTNLGAAWGGWATWVSTTFGAGGAQEGSKGGFYCLTLTTCLLNYCHSPVSILQTGECSLNSLHSSSLFFKALVKSFPFISGIFSVSAQQTPGNSWPELCRKGRAIGLSECGPLRF